MRARGTRRFATRLGLAVTLLLVSLAVLVRLASAHHPELTASATCGTGGAVVRWTAVAWQTTESDRRVNHDVRVQAYISGTWQEIGRSSFSAANNYEFTGTYDLPAAVTGTLPLKVTSIVRWGEAENYGSGGEYRQTTVSIPSSCPGGGGEPTCGGTLGVASDYNLFVRGSVLLAASDIGGRVAVGGDARFTSYTIGSATTPSSARVDLAVDGTLTATGGVQVSSGSVTYGNELVGALSVPRGVVSHARAPFVATAFAGLYTAAAAWAAVAPNGTIDWSTGDPRTLTLTGTSTTINVWRLSAADLQTARQIRIKAPQASTMLISVTGSGYDTNQAGLSSVSLWNGNGFAQYAYPSTDPVAVAYRTHLLWNFAQASTVQIGPGLSWEGSVLAPYAAVELTGGAALNGAVLAAGATMGTSAVATELHPYNPSPPCLPPTGPTTTVPSGGTTTVPGVDASGPTTLPAPPTTLSPYCIAYGDLAGTVFEDHNANGVKDPGGTASAVDRGVAGVTVKAYDSGGTVVGTAVSGADGGYRINVVRSASRDVRVEFSTLPAGYRPGSITPTGGGVQFVSLCDQGVDLALQIPAHYCQDNPDLAGTCQRKGASTKPAVLTQKWGAGWNAAASDTAPSVAAEYATGYPGGTAGTDGHPVAVGVADVGSVSALAWRARTRTLYAGAYVKSAAVLGPAGPGAVYAVPVAADGTGTAPTVAVVLPTGAGGTPALGADGTPANFDDAGRTGLGGMALVADPDDASRDTLYVVGLADRRLYAVTHLDAASKHVTSMDLPLGLPGAAQGCSPADVRPFALTAWSGTLYAALTCTAETSQNAQQVRAYVYVLTPTGAWSPTPALELPLTYDRGPLDYWANAPRVDQFWQPWNTNTDVAPGQALVTGLAITQGTGAEPGDLVVALRSRTGDRTGVNAASSASAGDLLRSPRSGAGWVPEPGLSTTSHNEYFLNDGYPFSVRETETSATGHLDATRGAVAAIPGFADVATSQLTNWWTSGIAWHSLATGRIDRAMSLMSAIDDATAFGKTNSLGDLVALCDQAPIEVGDRVWADTNDNGVQDVGEYGLAGVTVELRAANGTLVATTTTDGMGQYAFRGLTPHAGYQVRVPLDQAALAAKGYREAGVHQGGNPEIDNDGARAGTVVTAAFTTGSPGSNDHSVDIGLFGPPADRPRCACATTTTTLVEALPPPPPA